MTSPALPVRFTVTCVAALALNALSAITLPSASAKIVAAIGVVISASVLLAVHAWPAARLRLRSNPPAFFVWPGSMTLVCVAFLVPALFFRAAPVLGFWRFDGRAALL